jgi:hypothetical protein
MSEFAIHIHHPKDVPLGNLKLAEARAFLTNFRHSRPGARTKCAFVIHRAPECFGFRTCEIKQVRDTHTRVPDELHTRWGKSVLFEIQTLKMTNTIDFSTHIV